MRFRPCIDIHNGKVKQIVGGSLRDEGDTARENFVSEKDAAWYARYYRQSGFDGGHIILLNHRDSPWYEKTLAQAMGALAADPGRWQAGGGITADNAGLFLENGAAAVIVTSWVFSGGRICWENLERLCAVTGPERLVLDLSCRAREDGYYVVTDRWQKFTEEKLSEELLERLGAFAGEFLVHAADVEGLQRGPQEEVLRILGRYEGRPVTYAGGVSSLADLDRVEELGRGRVDVTVGSALDLFGGPLPYRQLVQYFRGRM